MKNGLTEDAVQETPVSESLEGDARWELAQRVAASKGLTSSALLAKFLLYVCDRQLRGRVSEITEYQIGVQVFGRRTSYNPNDDNIVRQYARLLRKRLDNYFDGEGCHEPFRINIPRGGYVPVFHPQSPAKDSINGSTKDVSLYREGTAEQEQRDTLSEVVVLHDTAGASTPLRQKAGMRWARAINRRVWWVAVCIVILGAGVLYVAGLPGFMRPRSGSHLLWSQLFSKDKETFVVPADSGLVFLEDIAGRPLSLKEYEKRQYLYNLSLPAGIDQDTKNDLNSARYTSVSDLNIVSRLSRLPEMVPDRFVIRYARELHMDDIKHSNVILIGSVYSNPWVELFEDKLNFQFDYKSYATFDAIVNRHPRDGEPPLFRNNTIGNANRTYAVMAFLPSLDGNGRVLILEGLTMAGTEAAQDLLFDENAMAPILEKARAADGSLKPFELLIETSGISADAPTARVIASRYY
ncbi:hypothetical protein [Terriglobus albidus]|uniref:hypothetical protein n=1 Tax=Terriglobus albidus TaxID=1592106 RepID=UPI0021E0E307|nr:hypothetical protein [Terriglobus albidus]